MEIVVIGAGGHGSEVLAYLETLTAGGDPARLVGFIDERRSPGSFESTEILGSLDELRSIVASRSDGTLGYITAMGDNRARKDLVSRVEALGLPTLRPWTLVHPAACVGRAVRIGHGSLIAPGAVVTTRVSIGRHVIVNVNASVSHDATVGDFANINPGAVVAGHVHVAEGCFIGAGATIIDRVTIGAWTTVGAGAVVVRDLPPGVTAVGVPARIIASDSDRCRA